jgi:hypothetical protein
VPAEVHRAQAYVAYQNSVFSQTSVSIATFVYLFCLG